MKKYITNLADSAEKTEVQFTDADKVKINNKEYTYDYRFINDNVLILRMNDNNYSLTVSKNEDEDYFEVNLNSAVYNIVSKNELDLLIESMSGKKGDSSEKKEIYSPRPGIIKKLNVTEGQNVTKGQVLFVLEAMKMENEIKAKKDCVIKKVNVEEMKSVEKNELLIVLE